MEIQVRAIELNDAQGINQLRRMSGVFENILSLPSERVVQSELAISELNENSHEFVATVKSLSGEELVVGQVSLNIFSSPRLRHSATLDIMIHRDYQGKGVGKKLMETVLDLADNWLLLVRVELSVFANNEAAVNLYKSFGFEIEGIMKKSSIYRGGYIDEYMMSRIKEFSN